MPNAVAIQPLAVIDDIAFEVLEPPDEHPWRNAADGFVLDPALNAAIRKDFDATARRLDCLARPPNVQRLRWQTLHCTVSRKRRHRRRCSDPQKKDAAGSQLPSPPRG